MISLATKPDFARCLERIEAWFHQAVLDRPPVRFYKHNAQFDADEPLDRTCWASLEERWFDTEYQLDSFEQSIAGIQRVPLLRRVLATGKSLVVGVPMEELDAFMEQMPREGVLLCLGVEEGQEPGVIRRVERWGRQELTRTS